MYITRAISLQICVYNDFSLLHKLLSLIKLASVVLQMPLPHHPASSILHSPTTLEYTLQVVP